MISLQRSNRSSESLVDVFRNYDNCTSPATDISVTPSVILSRSEVIRSMQRSEGRRSGLESNGDFPNDLTLNGLKKRVRKNLTDVPHSKMEANDDTPIEYKNGRQLQTKEYQLSEVCKIQTVPIKMYESKYSSSNRNAKPSSEVKQSSGVKLWTNCVSMNSVDASIIEKSSFDASTSPITSIVREIDDKSPFVKINQSSYMDAKGMSNSHREDSKNEENNLKESNKMNIPVNKPTSPENVSILDNKSFTEKDDGFDYYRRNYYEAQSNDRLFLEKPSKPKLDQKLSINHPSKRFIASKSKLNKHSYQANDESDRLGYNDYQSDITRRRLLTTLNTLQRSNACSTVSNTLQNSQANPMYTTPNKIEISPRPSSSASLQPASLAIYNLGVWPISDRGVKLPAAKTTGCWVTDGHNANWKVQLTDREIVQVIRANPGDPVFRRFGLGSHRNPYLDLPFGMNSSAGFHSSTKLSSPCGQMSQARINQRHKSSFNRGRLNRSAGTVRGSGTGRNVESTQSTGRNTALDVCGLSVTAAVEEAVFQKAPERSRPTLILLTNPTDYKLKSNEESRLLTKSSPRDLNLDNRSVTVPNNSPAPLSYDESDDFDQPEMESVRRHSLDGEHSKLLTGYNRHLTSGGFLLSAEQQYERHLPNERGVDNEKTEIAKLPEKNIQKIKVYIPY